MPFLAFNMGDLISCNSQLTEALEFTLTSSGGSLGWNFRLSSLSFFNIPGMHDATSESPKDGILGLFTSGSSCDEFKVFTKENMPFMIAVISIL